MGKISVKKSQSKPETREKVWHGKIFDMNFNLKGGLAVDFMEC